MISDRMLKNADERRGGAGEWSHPQLAAWVK